MGPAGLIPLVLPSQKDKTSHLLRPLLPLAQMVTT